MGSANRLSFTWIGISGIGIAIAAVVLRFWKLAEMPFSHDEFSALFRARHSDFHSLIELGVKTDTHPPGVQVLFWLIRNFWGEEVLAFKLPFVIMGVLSVWLFYQIGRFWASWQAASVSSAFLAVAQIAVMQSQQARPYSAGLFFCLLALWAFTQFQVRDRKTWLLLFAFSLSLGAYSHHFAALQGAVIFLSALLTSKRSDWKWVIGAGIISFGIYLPNFSILSEQLKLGGIGTVLAAPDITFFAEYFHFLAHHSLYFGGFLLLAVGMSLYGLFRQWPSNIKMSSLALLALLPGVIGTLYSVYRAPVLMERSLYFSLPFLALLLSSGFAYYKLKISSIIAIVLLMVGSLSLIIERQHFRMTHLSGYRETLRESQSLMQKGWAKESIFISGYQPILEFESHELGIAEKHYTRIDEENGGSPFLRSLIQRTPERIALGRTMQYFYPDPGYDALCYAGGLSLTEAKYWFNSDLRIFQAGGIDLSVYRNRFPQDKEAWAYEPTYLQDGIYNMEEGHEWGPTIELDLADFIDHPNNELSAYVELHSESKEANVELVSVLSKGEEIVHYHSKALDYSRYPLLSLGLKLADIPENPQDLRWKFFLWNRDKKALDICRMEVIILEGNPYQYAWYQKIEP